MSDDYFVYENGRQVHHAEFQHGPDYSGCDVSFSLPNSQISSQEQSQSQNQDESHDRSRDLNDHSQSNNQSLIQNTDQSQTGEIKQENNYFGQQKQSQNSLDKSSMDDEQESTGSSLSQELSSHEILMRRKKARKAKKKDFELNQSQSSEEQCYNRSQRKSKQIVTEIKHIKVDKKQSIASNIDIVQSQIKSEAEFSFQKIAQDNVSKNDKLINNKPTKIQHFLIKSENVSENFKQNMNKRVEKSNSKKNSAIKEELSKQPSVLDQIKSKAQDQTIENLQSKVQKLESTVKDQEVEIQNLKKQLHEKERIECAICLTLVTERYKLEKCSHDQFHKVCVEMWMKGNQNCPMCRQ